MFDKIKAEILKVYGEYLIVFPDLGLIDLLHKELAKIGGKILRTYCFGMVVVRIRREHYEHLVKLPGVKEVHNYGS